MWVRFRSAALQESYATHAKAGRLWGEPVARKYIQRVDALYAADSADDLFKIPPLRFHPLPGDMTGRYSLVLHGRARMIISFEDQAMTHVVVEEVSTHYDD